MRIKLSLISICFALLFLLGATPAWGQMRYIIVVTTDPSADMTYVYNDVTTEDDSTGCSNHSSYHTDANISGPNGEYIDAGQISGFDASTQYAYDELTSGSENYRAAGSLNLYCGCASKYVYSGFENTITILIKFSSTYTWWGNYVAVGKLCIPQSTACTSGTPTVTDPEEALCLPPFSSCPPNPSTALARYENILIIIGTSSINGVVCKGIAPSSPPGPCT